jgi:hypothetical protein
MTRKEQYELTAELIDRVRKDIINRLDKVPEKWDGIELRLFVADHFIAATAGISKKHKRYQDYKNTVLVDNLV